MEFAGDFEEPPCKWCIPISVAAHDHNLRFGFRGCLTSGNTQEEEQRQPSDLSIHFFVFSQPSQQAGGAALDFQRRRQKYPLGNITAR